MRRPRSVCALDLRLGPVDELRAPARRSPPLRRHREPVGHAAGGLDQAGGGQVGLVEHHARREAHEAGAAVGLDDDDLRDAQAGVAEQQRVADLQVERVEQRRVDPDACPGRARAPGSTSGVPAPPFEAQLAAQRIAVADRLHGDQPRARRPSSSGARPMLGKAGGAWRSQAQFARPWRRTRPAPAGRWRRSRRRRAAAARRAPGRC